MKLGIVLPVGPLDRFGYQHNCDVVVREHCAFADHVVMCSTSRNRARVDEFLAQHTNLEYIGDESTWFDVDDQGRELFSVDGLKRRTNRGIARCQELGLDCALNIQINQIVPRKAQGRLREHCQRMLDEKRPFEWLHKRYMLRNQIFHCDKALPWIFNVQLPSLAQISNDAVIDPTSGQEIRVQSGEMKEFDAQAIVDFPMEMTPRDLQDVREFTRCYTDINPGARADYSWERYLTYYTKKFVHKRPCREPLDPVCAEIAARSRPDFVSHAILENLARTRGFRGMGQRLWQKVVGKQDKGEATL